MDKVSYALGLSIGQNFKASGFENVKGEDFLAGMNTILEGQEPKMTIDEAKATINAYFAGVQEKAVKLNKEAGEEFLRINGHKAGVTTLPSGLQYEVLTEGTGDKPKLSDTVRCHYHGTLINGVVFDSSMERGEPAEFPLQGVIKGWTEILQLMPVGSKWKVTIPSNLAYGDRGAGQHIQPGSTLIFVIDLIAIVQASAMKCCISALSIGLALCLSACSIRKGSSQSSEQALSNRADSVAYAFGLINGSNFAKLLATVPGDSLARRQVLKGFAEQLQGQETLLSLEQARSIFQSYVRDIQDAENKQRLAKNDSVLSANKLKPNVITTESGLQYRILRQGIGAKVESPQDTVQVHYKGQLIDGKVFDSSYERGVPARFPVGQVIEGWTEVLQLMSVGAKYEVYIPANLGYGDRGAGDAIPPQSVLIFDIELLDVTKRRDQQAEITVQVSKSSKLYEEVKGKKENEANRGRECVR